MITDSGEIICHTTPWYTRRRLLMVAMLFFFSAYFAYDWKIGYPKQRVQYEEYWPIYQKMKAEDLKGYTDMAVEKGWPKEPHEQNWDYKLKEQLIWCIGTGIGGLLMLGAWLRFKGKTLRADDVAFTTPDGQRIPFASVEKVDKRKWDNKALAYAFWRESKESPLKKATIDDLVFDDAGKVFDRLLENFQGELVDIERPAPEAEPAPENVPSETPEPEPGAAAPVRESPTPSGGA